MAEANKNSAPAKTSTTAVKKTDEKLPFFKRIGKWFREFRSEVKKVVWPTPKQTANNTVIVIVCVIIVGIFIWIFDWLAGAIISALLDLFRG